MKKEDVELSIQRLEEAIEEKKKLSTDLSREKRHSAIVIEAKSQFSEVVEETPQALVDIVPTTNSTESPESVQSCLNILWDNFSQNYFHSRQLDPEREGSRKEARVAFIISLTYIISSIIVFIVFIIGISVYCTLNDCS